MLIERFGENENKQWYKCVGEEIVECDEKVIHILWCNWVTSPFAERQDDDEFKVFAFKIPVELDLDTAERW